MRSLLAEGGARTERDVEDAALTMAVLMDRSKMLERASMYADVQATRLQEAQGTAIGDALIRAFDDLGVPRNAAIRDVGGHYLRPLSEPDAPTGPAPDAKKVRLICIGPLLIAFRHS